MPLPTSTAYTKMAPDQTATRTGLLMLSWSVVQIAGFAHNMRHILNQHPTEGTMR
jgi:hypothetical protein